MKRRFVPFLLLPFVLLAACTRTLTAQPATEIVLPTETPVPPASATFTPEEAATATEAPAEETATEEAASPTPEAPSETPTSSPTATLPVFDPNSQYGGPTLFDSFSEGKNWVDGGGSLPDTDFIRLALGGGKMHVTGKPPQFDTWWFSWPTAGDQFIEMTMETDTCSGKQAYGLILRGPSSNTAARGYILTFSCDGAYRLVRLDNASPYTTVELIPWTPSSAINAGSDKSNILGVSLIGDTITIYANRSQIAQIADDRYASGRYAFFVNAGAPGNFTFSVDELAFWNLD